MEGVAPERGYTNNVIFFAMVRQYGGCTQMTPSPETMHLILHPHSAFSAAADQRLYRSPFSLVNSKTKTDNNVNYANLCPLFANRHLMKTSCPPSLRSDVFSDLCRAWVNFVPGWGAEGARLWEERFYDCDAHEAQDKEVAP